MFFFYYPISSNIMNIYRYNFGMLYQMIAEQPPLTQYERSMYHMKER